jgi:hypothetical protein
MDRCDSAAPPTAFLLHRPNTTPVVIFMENALAKTISSGKIYCDVCDAFQPAVIEAPGAPDNKGGVMRANCRFVIATIEYASPQYLIQLAQRPDRHTKDSLRTVLIRSEEKCRDGHSKSLHDVALSLVGGVIVYGCQSAPR